MAVSVKRARSTTEPVILDDAERIPSAAPANPAAANAPYSAAGSSLKVVAVGAPPVARVITPARQIATPAQPSQESGSPSNNAEPAPTKRTSVLEYTVPTAKSRNRNERSRAMVARICDTPPRRTDIQNLAPGMTISPGPSIQTLVPATASGAA